MRRLRMTFGLAVAAGALAVSAAPAMGLTQFVASRQPKPITETEPGNSIGHSVGVQEFVFGVFHIKCASAGAKGIINKPEFKDFATAVKFGKCLTEAHFGTFTGGLKTAFNEGKPVFFVYHINGFVELGTESEEGTEVSISGGEANFKISGKICKISWPAQTVPAGAVKKPESQWSAAVYSNEEVPNESLTKFPSGFQKKLVIADEFKGMEFVYEEGQCVGEGGFEEGAPHTEGKTAKYIGTIRQEVAGGNLSVE
jgi:hypothetical protein